MSIDALLDPIFRSAPQAQTRQLRDERARFVYGTTPIQPLHRLRQALGGGPKLWVKRDDLTGLALGGNKTRKLEYLVASALAEGADTLVTVGAAQSNHARQTAAAAAQLGLDAVLVLRVPRGCSDEYVRSGNVLLDQLFGARLVYVTETAGTANPEDAAVQTVLQELRQRGRAPWLIPVGGSTPVGSLGYLESYAEIVHSGIPFDEIIVASGSGGTQAGLLLGRALLSPERGPNVRGVAVLPAVAKLRTRIDQLVSDSFTLLGNTRQAGAAALDAEQVGQGYGVPTDAAVEAIRLFARTEGILLDPVYTGKAAAALISRVRAGAYGADQNILFLHTGGAPALFAYASSLGADVTVSTAE